MALTFTTLLTHETGPILYWLTGAHDAHEAFASQLADKAPCTLIACQSDDWNNDYSPWEAAALPGQPPFGGHGNDTLNALLAHARRHTDRPLLLGGYSLAGLFALWTHTQCRNFAGVAACSPSLWYPGWDTSAAAAMPQNATVYLSLGRREEKTRYLILSTVGNAVRAQHAALETYGIPSHLVWHDGGHFTHPDLRMLEGFNYLLAHL